MTQKDEIKTPANDVEHDKKAMRQAEKRMHAKGTGDDNEMDPTGGHDPKALEDAAEKFAVER